MKQRKKFLAFVIFPSWEIKQKFCFIKFSSFLCDIIFSFSPRAFNTIFFKNGKIACFHFVVLWIIDGNEKVWNYFSALARACRCLFRLILRWKFKCGENSFSSLSWVLCEWVNIFLCRFWLLFNGCWKWKEEEIFLKKSLNWIFMRNNFWSKDSREEKIKGLEKIPFPWPHRSLISPQSISL